MTPEQIDLAERVLDQVRSYPETHRQADYQCGTQLCIAGWAIALHYGVNDIYEDWQVDRDRQIHGGTSDLASHLLGLTYFTSYTLFHALLSESKAVEILEDLIKNARNAA